MTPPVLLEIIKVTKKYGGIPAIEAVDFDLHPGEIHALVGENGAGKSTLCKVIAGVIPMDHGQMLIDGEPLVIETPRDSFEKGIFSVRLHRSSYRKVSTTFIICVILRDKRLLLSHRPSAVRV